MQTSDIILKAREVKTNVDLSTVDVKGNAHGKGTTTANCYVIHNPGTYRFPTIYGNAKKNGATNEKAYKSSKTGPNILTKFLKADGNAIDKPQIDGIANACLIWQDTKDLISNISYNANYVSFEVKKETIHNGNAIIAVRNASNEILWSWHIWVTERDLSSVEVTNFQNKTYKFLPVNLGWCGFGNEWYAPREVKTRLKQAGGKTAELTFQSNGEVLDNDYDLKNGNNPYYQWGRKDPMLPGNGLGDKDKTCFTTDTQYAFQHTGLNTADIKEYIRNPHKFNTKREMDGQYYNLWSTDNERTDANDELVIKSVYDPCPVGYSLPASNAFTGFTTTGGNVGSPPPAIPFNIDRINAKSPFDNGWYFYTKKNKQGNTFFFQASGWRISYSGTLDRVTTFGFYWVAIPNTIPDRGRNLGFNFQNIFPLDFNYNNSFGFAVRSAEEKYGKIVLNLYSTFVFNCVCVKSISFPSLISYISSYK